MTRQGQPSALGRRHRVYIAGPMKGLPGFNFPAFFEAEARWRALGWDVVNPAAMDQEIDGFDPDREPAAAEAFCMRRDLPAAEPFYMRRDLPAVAGCDAIALLPGWETSSGALKEARVALWCGLAVLDAVTGERIAAGIAAPVDERHPGEHQGAER